jgi:hypothetical protein
MISLIHSLVGTAKRRLRVPTRYLVYAGVMVVFIVTGRLAVHNPSNNVSQYQSGDLIQANGDPAIYVVDGANQKRHIVSIELFNACGYRNEEIQPVSNDLLKQIPSAPPIRAVNECWVKFRPGDIVKGAGSAAVFVIDRDNRKRLIASPAIFTACGYQQEEVLTVSNPILTRMPSAEDIRAVDQCWIKVNPGDLVKGRESSVVFVVDDGYQRRRIATQDLFVSCGYRMEDVKVLPESLIQNLVGGPDITNKCSSDP